MISSHNQNKQNITIGKHRGEFPSLLKKRNRIGLAVTSGKKWLRVVTNFSVGFSLICIILRTHELFLILLRIAITVRHMHNAHIRLDWFQNYTFFSHVFDVSSNPRSWRCILDTTLFGKVGRDLWQVGGFLRFPPPIKLTVTIQLNTVKSGVKHHNPA